MTAESSDGAPLRVGIVGCGNVAVNWHLPAYQAAGNLFSVVAVADPTPAARARAQAAGGLDDASVYESHALLLTRADIDVVDVCTPPALRRDVVVAAARAGKHVIAEKPLATVPADAAAMVAAADEAGVTLAMIHNYLFFPNVATVLDSVADGEIGDVEVAIVNNLGVVDHPGNADYRPRWRHEVAAGGGVLMDILHLVYLAEALLGAPIRRVSAWVDAREPGSQIEDIAVCRFESDQNVALVNVGWGVGPNAIELSGTAGRIFATFDGPVHVVGSQTTRQVQGSFEPADYHRSFVQVLSGVAGAIRGATPPPASGAAGQHMLEAILAAYKSAALGTTVELPLDPADPVYRRGLAGLAELELPSASQVLRRGLYGFEPQEVR